MKEEKKLKEKSKGKKGKHGGDKNNGSGEEAFEQIEDYKIFIDKLIG